MTKVTKTTYASSGIDINESDAAKAKMAKSIDNKDPRVINKVGAFASLFRFDAKKYDNPLLVLKMEEPGSKQLLAFADNRVETLAQDLINHLVNDIAVMGAEPLAVLDCIVCGKLENEKVVQFVDALARGCRSLGCSLVGGETSIQPGVLADGRYVLSASVVGVVDEDKLIDGSKIKDGDVVIAVASNGLHTNGYTLVRKLMDQDPGLKKIKVENGNFFDAIMRPHLSYLKAIQALIKSGGVTGLAHITGGGIEDNFKRILPENKRVEIDVHNIRVPEIFKTIEEKGSVPQADMFRTFNMGVGLIVTAAADKAEAHIKILKDEGHQAYAIGKVTKGERAVVLKGVAQ